MEDSTTSSAVRDVLTTIPGPRAPARPTTPERLVQTVVEPLLTALGHQYDRSDGSSTVLQVQIPQAAGTAAVAVVGPGCFRRYRTDEDRLRAVARDQLASVVLVTEGYRWTVAAVSEDTAQVTRLFDLDCTAAWRRLHGQSSMRGYAQHVINRASVQTIVESLSPTALLQWHRTGTAGREQNSLV